MRHCLVRFCAGFLRWARKQQASNWIAALSAMVAAAAVVSGVVQYRSSEGWQRAQFVAAQLKDFQSDRINQDVLRMMDYDPANIELYPERENAKEGKKAYAEISFATLTKSIKEDAGFSDIEFRVKQDFEHFLKSLDRFNYFMSVGAIETKELCPDFQYPVALMVGDTDVRKSKLKNSQTDIAPFAKAVREYLDRWNYSDVKEFFDRIERECNY